MEERELIEWFNHQILVAKRTGFTNTECMYQSIVNLVKSKNKELKSKDKLIKDLTKKINEN